MKLLIDCGNSSIKLAINKSSSIGRISSIDYSSYPQLKRDLSSTIKGLKAKNKIKAIYIVSVNKEIDPLLKEILSKNLKGIPLEFLNKRKFKNFKCSYKKSTTFGLDRFFSCLGGTFLFPKKNLIIVDMGTATTIDVIDKELLHMGGLIIPGALTAHHSLLRNTAIVQSRELLLKDKLLGCSTEECISSGFINGQSFMIKGIVDKIKKSSELRFKVLITGGIANIFNKNFSKYQYEPSLVLNGMRFYLASKE